MAELDRCRESLREACGGWCSVAGSSRTFAWTESLAHHPDGGVVEAVVAVDATQRRVGAVV